MRDALQSDTRRAVLFLAALCALLYVNWVFTVARFQPNVMYWDQWENVSATFPRRRVVASFHAPERAGSGGLGARHHRWILEATQWDVRYDSLWGASALLLAAVLAVRLKWKMTGAIGFRDAWIPLLCLSPGQFETVLVVGQPAHSVLPFALILLAANIWLSPNPTVKYLVGAVVAVMLTFTGFGLFAGAALTVLLVTRACRHALEGERRLMWLAVAGIALSAAGWVVFRRDYVFNPALGNFSWWWSPWTDYVRFIAPMLGLPLAAVGQPQLPYLAGSVLALVAGAAAIRIAWVWLKDRPSPRHDVLVTADGVRTDLCGGDRRWTRVAGSRGRNGPPLSDVDDPDVARRVSCRGDVRKATGAVGSHRLRVGTGRAAVCVGAATAARRMAWNGRPDAGRHRQHSALRDEQGRVGRCGSGDRTLGSSPGRAEAIPALQSRRDAHGRQNPLHA